MATAGLRPDSARLARQASLEKRARKHRVKMADLALFTSQLAAMLGAGLPIVTALEAMQDQTEDEVFQVIIRDVRTEISAGSALSDAARKFPRAFPNLFVSMVEAGEASGSLAEILTRVGAYLEASVKLVKKVKAALVYPIAVILLAVILVAVLLIYVIPVFDEMYSDFGGQLPGPTRALIAFSAFLKGNILWVILGMVAMFKGWTWFIGTPRGREFKDNLTMRLPIFGRLSHRVALSRFCRTYATLVRSGVPLLRTLEIVAASSGRVQIERACLEITRQVTAGGQVSDVLMGDAFFPSLMRHMIRAGEQTGNVDGMLTKVADFYDTEAEAIIAALTSLIEPMLIVFLGVVVGGIVMAMFLPIFNLAGAAGGLQQ